MSYETPLIRRLRGEYGIGPANPGGEPEMGYRTFPVPPINIEAAAEIARLTDEVERLRANNQALQEAGLLDADGNLRKIIGTLPVTKDGCIFGDGTLWYATLDHEVTVEMFRSPVDREKGWQPFHYRHCYSTREAAERAAKGATDGQ